LVTIHYREGSKRQGKVIRLLADLSKEGRMARLLVEVRDPLDLQVKDGRRPPLLIDEYVRVQIEGDFLEDVYRIPRYALRNDSQVWILHQEEKLAIRPVKTIWRDEEYVFVREGLHPDDLLIMSALAAPVDGMQLRREQTELAGPEPHEKPAESKD
jgi:multidrug efflux system membrane fusion protein